jgi:hypothetical protein
MNFSSLLGGVLRFFFVRAKIDMTDIFILVCAVMHEKFVRMSCQGKSAVEGRLARPISCLRVRINEVQWTCQISIMRKTDYVTFSLRAGEAEVTLP